MPKIAFVFPGQGAQRVGMGRDVFAQYPAARAVFEAADRALEEPLSRLCFEGPEADLQLTANTQPAVLTTSVALLRALDFSCEVAAGHSLGEYTANVAAGTMDFAEAVRLVRIRGMLMQEAVPVGTGAMAAVMGLDKERVIEACASVTSGIVEAVNFNCPGQTVIAGMSQAVEDASASIRERGGKVIAIPVSAPFHSSLMKPAEERLVPRFETLHFSDPRVPIYVNVDAEPTTQALQAKSALLRQVSRPVRWEQTVVRMLQDGVTHFVEIGPGKVLTGLIGRISKDAVRMNVQTAADVETVRAALAALR